MCAYLKRMCACVCLYRADENILSKRYHEKTKICVYIINIYILTVRYVMFGAVFYRRCWCHNGLAV